MIDHDQADDRQKAIEALRAAYRHGVEHRLWGRPFQSCIYLRQPYRAAWQAGYNETDRDLRTGSDPSGSRRS